MIFSCNPIKFGKLCWLLNFSLNCFRLNKVKGEKQALEKFWDKNPCEVYLSQEFTELLPI